MGIDKDKNQPTEAAELRRRAEEELKAKRAVAPSPRTEAESQRLLHELEVHQIELEMQNAELLKTRDELEKALWKSSPTSTISPRSATLPSTGKELSAESTSPAPPSSGSSAPG